MPIFRVVSIFLILSKYRLDQLILSESFPLPIKFLLFVSPMRWMPRCEPSLSRGERIRLALEELGPVFIKFGQLLSTRPDLVAADIVSELDKLQDNVPPFETKIFIGIVEQALGQPIDQAFLEFDRKAIGFSFCRTSTLRQNYPMAKML